MQDFLRHLDWLRAQGAGTAVFAAIRTAIRAVSPANGHEAVVRALLAKGADARTSDGFNPLAVAAANGSIEVVKALLYAKVAVDTTAVHGTTALILASQGDFAEVVTALLAKGTDVTAIDNSHRLSRSLNRMRVPLFRPDCC